VKKRVGARLDKLRKHGWRVFHSVPVGDRGSDIDHVVIGPGGVWTVNTKGHPGKSVWVRPQHDPRRRAHAALPTELRHEAERARRLLTQACGFPVFVKAALVFLTETLIPT
jgi:Nuclease-related domain